MYCEAEFSIKSFEYINEMLREVVSFLEKRLNN